MRKLAFVAAIVFAFAACGGSGGGGGGNTPEGAVNNVINAMKAKNFSAIAPMICAAKRDEISKKLDITTSLASSAPGLDRQKLLDAMTFDFKDLSVTKVSESGDTAVVAVKGSLAITLDPAKARDIVKAILSAGGKTPTDAEIDALLPTMIDALSKGTPINSQGDVVREGGTWLLCSDLTTPAAG